MSQITCRHDQYQRNLHEQTLFVCTATWMPIGKAVSSTVMLVLLVRRRKTTAEASWSDFKLGFHHQPQRTDVCAFCQKQEDNCWSIVKWFQAGVSPPTPKDRCVCLLSEAGGQLLKHLWLYIKMGLHHQPQRTEVCALVTDGLKANLKMGFHHQPQRTEVCALVVDGLKLKMHFW